MPNTYTALALLGTAESERFDEVFPLLAPNFVRTVNAAAGSQSPDELQSMIAYDAAWSNRSFEYEHVMETADGTVVVQHAERATHTGTWHGIAPTGKEVTTSCCHVFRFDDEGRIVSLETYEDHFSIAIQLGAIDLPM